MELVPRAALGEDAAAGHLVLPAGSARGVRNFQGVKAHHGALKNGTLNRRIDSFVA
jgi:hypothetical protein